MACRTCAREFVSDNTPLAQMGYCLTCRADADVTCTECDQPCKGAPDGKMVCRPCRAAAYFKGWLYADTTGGRLWRLTTAGLTPDWEETT